MWFGHTTSNIEDALGLAVMLAGFIIGLGAVTVVDVHGFLGRRSPYWTDTTIRVHKVTKPLIWLGMALAILGGVLVYRHQPWSGIVLWHSVIAVVLVLNGCFLSFVVSPELLARERSGRAKELLPMRLQIKIALSFVVSFVGWWCGVFLLALFVTS